MIPINYEGECCNYDCAPHDYTPARWSGFTAIGIKYYYCDQCKLIRTQHLQRVEPEMVDTYFTPYDPNTL